MACYIEKHANPVHGRRVDKLRSCGAWLVFRHYLETGKFKLSQGMFCQQHLLCPLCAQLRAGRLVAKYWERFQQVLGKSQLTRLTLTIKNGPDLRERFQHFVRSLNQLMAKARRARNGGRNVSEFSKFRGGVLSIETKIGEGSQQWHVHGHGLCLQDCKVDIAALRDEWKRTTGDSHNVDLRLVYDDPVGAFCECMKYAMKFADLPLADNWDAFGALGGKRLLRPWGALWGVKEPDDLTDDISQDEGPHVDRFFRYLRGGRRYVEVASSPKK